MPWPREQALGWGTQAKELGQSREKQEGRASSRLKSLLVVQPRRRGRRIEEGVAGPVSVRGPAAFTNPPPFRPKTPLSLRDFPSRFNVAFSSSFGGGGGFWACGEVVMFWLEISVKCFKRVRKFGVWCLFVKEKFYDYLAS